MKLLTESTEKVKSELFASREMEAARSKVMVGLEKPTIGTTDKNKTEMFSRMLLGDIYYFILF